MLKYYFKPSLIHFILLLTTICEISELFNKQCLCFVMDWIIWNKRLYTDKRIEVSMVRLFLFNLNSLGFHTAKSTTIFFLLSNIGLWLHSYYWILKQIQITFIIFKYKYKYISINFSKFQLLEWDVDSNFHLKAYLFQFECWCPFLKLLVWEEYLHNKPESATN